MTIANCRELVEVAEEAAEALQAIAHRCIDGDKEAAMEAIAAEVESVLPALKSAIGKFHGADD